MTANEIQGKIDYADWLIKAIQENSLVLSDFERGRRIGQLQAEKKHLKNKLRKLEDRMIKARMAKQRKQIRDSNPLLAHLMDDLEAKRNEPKPEPDRSDIEAIVNKPKESKYRELDPYVVKRIWLDWQLNCFTKTKLAEMYKVPLSDVHYAIEMRGKV